MVEQNRRETLSQASKDTYLPTMQFLDIEEVPINACEIPPYSQSIIKQDAIS
jgi:hypothetical protein